MNDIADNGIQSPKDKISLFPSIFTTSKMVVECGYCGCRKLTTIYHYMSFKCSNKKCKYYNK